MYGTPSRFSTTFRRPCCTETVDFVLQQLVAFAERHLSLEIQDNNVARGSFFDLHG
jgi:hypothetical protein